VDAVVLVIADVLADDATPLVFLKFALKRLERLGTCVCRPLLRASGELTSSDASTTASDWIFYPGWANH
jgi:hypothetical protein